eukprot:scaffold643_cov165-Ochromonas_danica.AAC.1
MNLLHNIGSFLGLTSPNRDAKSIQEEERANHSKDEAAEEIVAGRILMTEAIKRYGYSRSTLRAAVNNKKRQLNEDPALQTEEDPILLQNQDPQNTSTKEEASAINLPSGEEVSDSGKLDMIFDLIVGGKHHMSIKAVCEHFGVPMWKFKNERKKRKREEDGEEPIQKTGRKPSLNNQNRMRLQEEAHHKDLSKNSFSLQSLEFRIQELRQEEAIKQGSNVASVKPISKRTLARLARQVTPKSVRIAQTQNARRLQALTDAFSPITHVAVTFVNGNNYTPQDTEITRYPNTISKSTNQILTKIGVDKASRDCFVKFFQHLPLILNKAFTATTITNGWQASGICPFNINAMFEKCPTLRFLTEEQTEYIRNQIPVLNERSSCMGIIEDVLLEELFGHILPMPTRLVDGRPINHLRSLWLNGEGVLEKREEMRDKKRREREAKVSRELEKARKAATQGEKQRIMELMESGALSGKKGNPSYLQVGNPFFCTNPICSQQRRVPRDNALWVLMDGPLVWHVIISTLIGTARRKVASQS